MDKKKLLKTKFNIAWVSVLTVFIGAVLYVPALKFAEKEVDIVYKKVPTPVYINITPVENLPDTSVGAEVVGVEDGNLEVETSAEVDENKSVSNEVKLLTKNLKTGDMDPEVEVLQKYLNKNGFAVSTSGSGSLGKETQLFGRGTRDALIRFQEANRESILEPYGLVNGTGFLGKSTIDFINKSVTGE